MKKLVLKISIFLSLVLMILVPLSLLVKSSNSYVLNGALFKLKPHITTVVLGDSHTETAVNPALIPGTCSLAKSGENYLYTYYKLRHLLECNPQLKTVVLGCSYHNFAREYQESFLYGDKSGKCEDYYFLLDQEAKGIITTYSGVSVVRRLKHDFGLPFQLYNNGIIQQVLTGRKLTPNDVPCFGGYNVIDRHNLDPALIARKISSYFKGRNGRFTGTSQVMAQYLQKTLELCRRKGITVYLVNLPLTPAYRQMVPVDAVDTYDGMMRTIRHSYGNVRVIDWSAMSLDPDMFYDGDHVNARGASLVSALLARRLAAEVQQDHFSKGESL